MYKFPVFQKRTVNNMPQKRLNYRFCEMTFYANDEQTVSEHKSRVQCNPVDKDTIYVLLFLLPPLTALCAFSFPHHHHPHT